MRTARFMVATGVVGTMLMSSAAAGVAAPAIDGIISRGSLVGTDVLNETGTDQTIVKKVAVGKKTSAVWLAQNRSSGGQGLLQGSADSSCFRVRYIGVVGSDFTAEVVAGLPVNFNGGAAVVLEVRVKVKGCADPGAVKTVDLDASPAFDPGIAYDRVRLKVKAK